MKASMEIHVSRYGPMREEPTGSIFMSIQSPTTRATRASTVEL